MKHVWVHIGGRSRLKRKKKGGILHVKEINIGERAKEKSMRGVVVRMGLTKNPNFGLSKW